MPLARSTHATSPTGTCATDRRLNGAAREASRREVGKRGGHFPDRIVPTLRFRDGFSCGPELTVAVAESASNSLDPELQLMQAGFGRQSERLAKCLFCAVELTEPGSADSELEMEIGQNVSRHALAACVTLFPPPLEPDPIAAKGGAVHEFDQCIADGFLRVSPPHHFDQGALGTLGVAHNHEQGAEVREGACSRQLVFVQPERAPDVRDGFNGLSSTTEYDGNALMTKRLCVGVSDRLCIGQDPA